MPAVVIANPVCGLKRWEMLKLEPCAEYLGDHSISPTVFGITGTPVAVQLEVHTQLEHARQVTHIERQQRSVVLMSIWSGVISHSPAS